MGLTDLLFKRQKLQVGTTFPQPGFLVPALIEFDASISETHTDELEATSFPVEDGVEISDHLRKYPASIELEGMITNTPIVFLASALAPSPITQDKLIPGMDRVETAYAKLKEFQSAGVLVDVITSLRSYKSMALTSMSVTRDSATGNVLHVSLSLREIIYSTAMSMDLPVPEQASNSTPTNQGTQSSTTPASSADTELAQSVFDGLFF